MLVLGGTHKSNNLLCFSPDSRLLAAAGYRSGVYVWDVSDSGPPRVWLPDCSQFGGLAFFPDGHALGACSPYTHFRSLEVLSTYPRNPPRVRTANGFVINQGGDQLLIDGWELLGYRSAEGGILSFRRHDMSNGRGETWINDWIVRPPAGRSRLTPFSTVPGSGKILCADDRGTLVVLELDFAGRPLKDPDPTTIPIDRGVAVSPDGLLLATIWKNELVIRELESRNLVVARSGGLHDLLAVAYHPSGRLLATADRGGCIQYHVVDTGQELRTFDWRSGELLALAFSPDGLLGAATTSTGTVIVWDIDE